MEEVGGGRGLREEEKEEAPLYGDGHCCEDASSHSNVGHWVDHLLIIILIIILITIHFIIIIIINTIITTTTTPVERVEYRGDYSP